MRLLLPLLFVMVIVYWVCQLLWFVFVVHFFDFVASVLICFFGLFVFWIVNGLKKMFK